MNFLILGSGAREYALAKRIYKDKQRGDTIFCVGSFENYGMTLMGIKTLITEDINKIVEFSIKNKVDIVIPGGEKWLISDIYYKLISRGIKFFGPSKIAALIETDKIFFRKLLSTSNLKTYNPKFFEINFNNYNLETIQQKLSDFPVIKPTGIHGGKGVKIFGVDISDINEAMKYIKYFLSNKESVLLEELLIGDEFSFQSMTSGERFLHSNPIMDFKRLNEGNLGENTGSMGCVCYNNGLLPALNKDDIETVRHINENVIRVMNNYIRSMNLDRERYLGFIYGSYIKTKDGIKIIEFNARLGDPEAIPFLHSYNGNLRNALASILENTSINIEGTFNKINMTVVYLVPFGYPRNVFSNEILDLSRVNLNDLYLFYYNNITILNNSKMKFIMNKSRALAIALEDHLDLPRIIEKISGRFIFRRDIHSIQTNSPDSPTNFSYKDSGVDVENANNIVSSIQEKISDTQMIPKENAIVLSKLGDFSGLVKLKGNNSDTVLVTTIDGVGTKSSFTPRLFSDIGVNLDTTYKNLGRDIVNHCVNDMLVKGGNPLMFLDYIAASKLEKTVIDSVITGMSEECITNNCFLIGGETAEMPGIYTEGSYDIVGTMIGTVDKNDIIDGYSINASSKVYGLRSVSPHTNGYSAIRKCYNDNVDFNYYCRNNIDFAHWISAPHKCYYSDISNLGLKNIQGLCHITGGGYCDNLKRVLPGGVGIRLYKEKIFTNEFRVLQSYLKISDEDMLSTYNCGIGMVVFVDSSVNRNIPDNFIEIGEVFPIDNNSLVEFI